MTWRPKKHFFNDQNTKRAVGKLRRFVMRQRADGSWRMWGMRDTPHTYDGEALILTENRAQTTQGAADGVNYVTPTNTTAADKSNNTTSTANIPHRPTSACDQPTCVATGAISRIPPTAHCVRPQATSPYGWAAQRNRGYYGRIAYHRKRRDIATGIIPRGRRRKQASHRIERWSRR